MITLYGHPYSRAHRVMWMLRELGLKFDHVPTDFIHGGTKAAEFLAVNPNGRVPALVDDGFVLFESLAINLYLARKYGGPLAPTDERDEALAIQWSLWVANEIEGPLLFTAANLALFPEPDRRPDQAAIGLGKLSRPFGVLERLLGGQPYLLGDRFTVADLNVAAVMTLIPICGIDITAWPAMAGWLSLCLDRPAADDWKPIHFTIPRPDDKGLLAMFI
ncbi:MAG: glutathione S-transferase family protein [Sphingomicrobium sp.]